MPMDSFNWALKCAIGLLHISKEEELSPLRFKSSAIHALFGILQEKDYGVKQKRLTHFIQTFKVLMTFFSHLTSLTEGKTPPLNSGTGKYSGTPCGCRQKIGPMRNRFSAADAHKALLPDKLAIKAPLSVVQSTEGTVMATKEPSVRGNSTQVKCLPACLSSGSNFSLRVKGVEMAVSSVAEGLNSVNALLSDKQTSQSGSLESLVFSKTSNERPSSARPTLPLPFNWMNSEGNPTYPTNGSVLAANTQKGFVS